MKENVAPVAPVARSDQPLLEVDDLSTSFPLGTGLFNAVDHVSFSLKRGKVLGLVGESGSGKSMTGFSIMGLLEKPGFVSSGKIMFDGQDITRLKEGEMRRVRGRKIAMIFQDPMMTLNPVLRIDTQMIEAVLAHDKVSKSTARERARDALGKVGIPSPEERLNAYPHQFSGGMRQRVAIAIALLHKPDLIIADEPTTALDVTIQSQILAHIQTLAAESRTSIIWITHDLSVVSRLADEIAVMYAGRIVEKGSVEQVIESPSHPYTNGLIGSVPSRNVPGTRLAQIPGMTPGAANLPVGCTFRPRCNRATEQCRDVPAATILRQEHQVRCFHPVGIFA